METFVFEVALSKMKSGAFVSRECIKNDTVFLVHKNRLYQMGLGPAVRYPYVPTNADMLATDWHEVKMNS